MVDMEAITAGWQALARCGPAVLVNCWWEVQLLWKPGRRHSLSQVFQQFHSQHQETRPRVSMVTSLTLAPQLKTIKCPEQDGKVVAYSYPMGAIQVEDHTT